MKYMNFSKPESKDVQLGLMLDEGCLDLNAVRIEGQISFETPTLLEDVLRQNNGLQDLEKRLLAMDLSSLEEFVIPTGSFRPRQPVFAPQKVIGIGLNYHDHAKEVGKSLPTQPLLFAMYPNAVIGYDDAIVIPAMSDKIDYEAELGVIIGRRGRHIRVDEAIDYVAGYTIVNDISARDLQSSDSQWIRGKSFDTFAPMGPCMVGTSALGDGDGLNIRLRLNGETMQDSNTRNLIFKVPNLVSYISQIMTLEPGDVISTGTPSGVGVGRKPQVFLKPGDLVEVELEGIGTLQNAVIKE
jgi:2-keto-4-pentenoate hydratase/2-oxohepta-3-ene-1,7-dioic acid hydratase in catechol pathway